jgi:hypothetical protein
MNRFNEILHSINDTVSGGAGEMYGGKKRSDLKDSDFLFPQSRSFPIVTPQDIADAISNFGRMKGGMSYDAFLRKLYNMAKRKGPAFVAALPEASKEKLGIKKKVKANLNLQPGDKVKNINTSCMHYGSEGVVDNIESLPDNMGDVVVYTTTNEGPTWKVGDKLKKTEIQLAKAQENETPEMELEEYKDDFYGMSLGSIKSIATHAQAILNALDDPQVKENLTEPFLQGRIAITEDYMRTIHDYVMFSETEADTPVEQDSTYDLVNPEDYKKKKKIDIKDLPKYHYSMLPSAPLEEYQDPAMDNLTMSGDKPGLWDNIRKKQQREGKKYRPAKPGDKDRPDPETWKKLTK